MAKLGWLLMVVAAFSGQAFGCKCGGMGTCQKAQARGTMFVGQVLSVREPGKGQGQRVFRFRVAESFAGPERAGEELEVATGLGGGDCGIEFSLGQRYFVDASGSAGTLSTGSCTWTAPLVFAAVTLRQLRAQAAGDRLPDLSAQWPPRSTAT